MKISRSIFKPSKWKKLYTSLTEKKFPDKLISKVFIKYDSVDKSGKKPEDLEKTLRKGCKILDELGVKYWIGRGSLLGIHRDNAFLPGDIDIDVDVYTDKDIYRIIRRLPFDAFIVNTNRECYMQFAFLDRETDVVFDLWFFHERDGKLYNKHSQGQFWLPCEQINNLKTINYNGVEYPVPDPDWYCKYWYGKNWRLPKKYGEDWTIEYRQDCRGFVYSPTKTILHFRYFDE